jgi:F0F1-type ATP synthase assembly protein I
MILAIVSLLFQLGVKEVVSLNVLAVVMIATISERMMSNYARHGAKECISISGETLLLAVLSFLLFSWGNFQSFLLASPWILIVVLVINLIVGKFTGLRLLEYFRFWEILNKDEEKDK